MSLEENFAKLEGIIEKLEQDDISLEASFTCYNDGMNLLKQCNSEIEKIEKKVLKISEGEVLEEL